MFAELIHGHLKEAFLKSKNPKGKHLLQDGDSSQNSRKENDTTHKKRAKKSAYQ